MFKKSLKISSNNQLSGKDKDKFKSQLHDLFEKDSVDAIFKTSKKIVCNKVQGTSMVIYCNEKYPLFVDPTKKGDHFPTTFAVQAYPDLIKRLYIHDRVEEYIFKGANLMWPGVDKKNEIDEFESDDVRAIVSSTSGKVFAVGAMAMDFEEWEEDKNTKGQACFILQHIQDKLFEFSEWDEEDDIEVVFTKQVKKQEKEESSDSEEEQQQQKKPSKKEEKKESESEDEEDGGNDLAQFVQKKQQAKVVDDFEPDDEELEQLKQMQQQGKKGKGKGKPLPGKKGGFDDDDDFEDSRKKGKKGKKGGKKGKQQNQNDDQDEIPNQSGVKAGELQVGSGIPPAVMDEYVKESFMNALKLSVSDKMLPIDPSVLYASHMLLCKREGVQMDIKNSNYKKIGKFVQTMVKEGLIEYKEGKKGQAPMITRVFRTQSELADWQPTISQIGQKKGKNQDDEQGSGNKKDEFVCKIKVTSNYKPSAELVRFFNDEDCTKKTYSLQQVKEKINNYIKQEKLTEKKNIKLDPYLASFFPIGGDDEEEQQEEEKKEDDEEQEEGGKKKKRGKKTGTDVVTQAQLWAKVEKKLTIGHVIENLQTKTTSEHKGQFKGLQIVTERAHNKNITKVLGLEQYGFSLDKLSEKFQVLFACSVSKADLPGKKHKEAILQELILHANVLDDVKDFFVNECKIPEEHITLNNKLENKKKKQGGGFQK